MALREHWAGFTRLVHTVRHLRPVQWYGRLRVRLHRSAPDLAPPPPLRTVAAAGWTPAPARAASLTGPAAFHLLNRARIVDTAADWDDPRDAKLLRYNLHYFDDLNAHDAAARADWHRALIARWIDENPPGQGTGWEPYPVSLRIVNWVKWLLRGGQADAGLQLSLAVQARWLARRIEHHLQGNHLLANAKALIFAGLVFEGAEARDWYDAGADLFTRELDEQLLADGGHYERSPMYHLLVLEDVLDLINLHQAYGRVPPPAWAKDAARMLAWSQVMRHPDGRIPFFNDAAFGIALEPEQLDGYARDLGIDDAPVQTLDASGYVRLTAGDAVLLADIAPVGPDHLPAHAHADTLSFELSLHGRRVIVNGGTSEYGTGVERQRQRSTAAHATVVIDGENSSDVWSGFRVGRRARVVHAASGRSGDAATAEGAHDGYTHLTGRPVHRRRWTLRAGGLEVADEVTGAGTHTVSVIFPLGPGLRAAAVDGSTIEVTDDTTGDGVLRLRAGHGAVAHAESCTWHPQFGVAAPAWRIRLELTGTLPVRHSTAVLWQ